ncbi:MAG: hypothetical protein PF569_06860 [Candidatus Woesearchaeota archaeon]|jgi:hypothetical protein|nr:hypothetical protein [Candidatus Woesearchaeota archaeon]
MNLKEYYYSLEPKRRVEVFRNFYNEVHADLDIRADNEALLDFTEMIIETQDAIVIVNSLKEKMFKLNEDLEKTKTENKRLKVFKEKYQVTLDNVKLSYEEKLEEQKKEHEKELSRFISERLETATNEVFIEEDLPSDIVNFVKLQIEKIRELMTFEKKSVTEIKTSYAALSSNSTDLMMREFAKLIIEVIDEKNIFQHAKFKKIELQIMKRIEEALK